MEHKFANMQNGFNFLSTVVLRDYSDWRANKIEHGDGDDAHSKVHYKSNKKWKKIAHHETIYHIAEQIVSVNIVVQNILSPFELTVANFLIYLSI